MIIDIGIRIIYDDYNDTLVIEKGMGSKNKLNVEIIDMNITKYGTGNNITIVIEEYSETGILMDDVLNICEVV